MGLWSDASKGEESPWKNHRNAQPDSLAERVSERVANTGRERANRQRQDEAKKNGNSPPIILDGRTARGANRVFKAGKQSRGKK